MATPPGPEVTLVERFDLPPGRGLDGNRTGLGERYVVDVSGASVTSRAHDDERAWLDEQDERLDPDGTGSKVILAADRKGTPDQASWSPSSSHIVFRYRARNKVQLRVATAAGKDVTTIVETAGPYPHWVDE